MFTHTNTNYFSIAMTKEKPFRISRQGRVRAFIEYYTRCPTYNKTYTNIFCFYMIIIYLCEAV